MERYLKAGVISGTHGVRGMLRVKPWADSPEFLTRFKTVYIDGTAREVTRAAVHKSLVLLALRGIETLDGAVALRGKVVLVDREDVELPEGAYFHADLIGLAAVDAERGEVGRVTEVLAMPAQDVYVIEGNGKRYMIPAVPAYVKAVDFEAGVIRIVLIEGLESDAR